MVRARLALLALVVSAMPLAAQSQDMSAPAPAPTPSAFAVEAAAPQAAGPAMTSLSVAARPLAVDDASMYDQQRAGLGRPKAMMVVGLATFIAGAIVGDTPGTILMVGGAVIGLYGLYQYLQ